MKDRSLLDLPIHSENIKNTRDLAIADNLRNQAQERERESPEAVKREKNTTTTTTAMKPSRDPYSECDAFASALLRVLRAHASKRASERMSVDTRISRLLAKDNGSTAPDDWMLHELI